MRRRHRMPFGAEVLDNQGVDFRLWAPAATRVDLCLQRTSGELILPMRAQDGGWFSLVTDRAAPASRYLYCIHGGIRVPDPASRFQPDDVHGASEVIDPGAWQWRDEGWKGRPWEEVVLYELHPGSFTPQGTFTAVEDRLDHLLDLGVTAVELMPIADFPGRRNWGYDGAYSYAPDSRYGRPHDLKSLVDAAHAKGLMVFLDVVYNHFGPEGNYLHGYAPEFFASHRGTPWGAAINFDGPNSRVVRDFFIHNALYWLEEYRVDGLRIDAVHAIFDDSDPDILLELAQAVAAGPGARRYIHLVLENDQNQAHYLARDARLRPCWYVAQWNDDLHHALHVLATGESGGYYADYVDEPIRHLGRCLTEGFAYQGEPSSYRGGAPRGEPSKDLPPTALVSFLQNHDQVGNRALGERISVLASEAALRSMSALLLLSPTTPLLFMGQEWGTRRPFPFFCDFGPELANAVREGRLREFARFAGFNDEQARRRIPDPNAEETFQQAKLDWDCLNDPAHRGWVDFHRQLLGLRRKNIVPRLGNLRGNNASFRLLGDSALYVEWILGDASSLRLLANLGIEQIFGVDRPGGNLLYPFDVGPSSVLSDGILLPWAVLWFLENPKGSQSWKPA